MAYSESRVSSCSAMTSRGVTKNSEPPLKASKHTSPPTPTPPFFGGGWEYWRVLPVLTTAILTCHRRGSTRVNIKLMMVGFYSAASVSGSWCCAHWLHFHPPVLKHIFILCIKNWMDLRPFFYTWVRWKSCDLHVH